MAKLPSVAIIGRPNTGKSTLFNRLVGRRKAIVSDIPGTTRDHVASRVETDELDYLLVDTGGMGGGTEDFDLEDDVHAQSILALEHADLILFTVNSRESLTASDFEIADLLRRKRKKHVPIIIVLTKCDNPEVIDEILPQFYELHVSDTIIPISASHMIGVDDLQETVITQLKDMHFTKIERPIDAPAKIAIIGKPNVGKSSIVNAFMSDSQREKSPLIVSDIPGTTRDSVDVSVTYHDKEYIFIDTAGIKRRNQTSKDIETFSYFRSIRSLEESDITVLVLDASKPLSKQDKRIAGTAIKEGKGLIILLNKIDLVTKEEKETALREIELEIQYGKFAPVIPCSAQTREGLLKLFDTIELVQVSRTRRIATKDLMNWYRDTVGAEHLGILGSSKHITQAEDVPPTFVLFVKHPKQVQTSQLKYLERRMRETFGFEGTPIRWITKAG